jgi:hypothetical protein
MVRGIKIVNGVSWSEHRSGWKYALSMLSSLEHADGILLDGFLDRTFGHATDTHQPYEQEWVGFLHHPIHVCPWYFQSNLSVQSVLDSIVFKESLYCCRGIFTLSDYLADHVRKHIPPGIRVQSIKHPTETPFIEFDPEQFIREKKVIQVGAWMRRLTSVFKLKVSGYQKFIPVTAITLNYLKNEMGFSKNVDSDEFASVKILKHLTDRDYDQLLSESVVFLDLYDSSANNAIIECIVRNTPLIVNPLPAVVEYLGKDYPLYYHSLSEAESLLQDEAKILEAHLFLKHTLDKTPLDGSCFMHTFANSTLLDTV